MRKAFIITLGLLISLTIATSAYAAGWHKIGKTENPDYIHAPDGYKNTDGSLNSYWRGNTDPSDATKKAVVPHTGLQSGIIPTSNNKCKTCHAVHEGVDGGFKLLRNTSRATECDFCHHATAGVTDKKPYGLTKDPYGEHSLNGNTMKDPNNPAKFTIPEATADVIAANSIKDDGLSCGNCHSTHDAYTLNDDKAGGLKGKLLRRDPAMNGGDVLAGIQDVAGTPVLGDEESAFDEDEALSGFCGDCHNKNVSWDRDDHPTTGPRGTIGEGERPNKGAHPLGDVDGEVDVYGQLKRIVMPGDEHLSSNCASCHTSRKESDITLGENDRSSFPHQSRGHKLFGKKHRVASPISGFDYTGDPKRPMPKKDEVCRDCHGEGQGFAGIGDPDNIGSF